MKKILIIVLLVTVFVFIKNILFPATTQNNYIYTATNSPASHNNTNTPRPDLTIKFDPTNVKYGDKIGNMVIQKIGPLKGNKLSPDNVLVIFKGQVSLRGEVFHNEGGLNGDQVCMQNLDNESSAKMPALDPVNFVFFCFTNKEESKTIFKNGEKDIKDATIIIDDYTIQYFPIDIFDTATFISKIN